MLMNSIIRTKNFIFVVSVLVLLCFSVVLCNAGANMTTLSQAAAGKGDVLRVLWTVSAYHANRQSEPGNFNPQSLLFKPLDITPSRITFNGQQCNDVTSASEQVNFAQYLKKKYQVTPAELGLDDGTATVVRTNCTLPGFNEYLRIPNRKLLVALEGFLFIFEPAVNY
jgi:hypothetical protein